MYNEIVDLWKSYSIKTVSDLDKHLDNFNVLVAFHSAKMENNDITYYDTREIFENDRVINFSGSTQSVFEQRNQKKCHEFLKEKIIAKEQLTVNLVKEVHRVLTEGTYDEAKYIDMGERPGAFKRYNYKTGINEIGSPVDEVESDLKELIDEINDYNGTSFLKAAAYFHARFEYIRPFADGNGRVGRALLNYYLMVNDHPPFVIYGEDKNLYYECLQRYDEKEEIDPLYKFLVYEIEKAWKKTLEMSNKIKGQRKGLNKLLR